MVSQQPCLSLTHHRPFAQALLLGPRDSQSSTVVKRGQQLGRPRGQIQPPACFCKSSVNTAQPRLSVYGCFPTLGVQLSVCARDETLRPGPPPPPPQTVFLPLLPKILPVFQSSAPVPPAEAHPGTYSPPAPTKDASSALCGPQPCNGGITSPTPSSSPPPSRVRPHPARPHGVPCPGRPQRGRCAAAEPPSAGCGWHRPGPPRAPR